jgi:hypothetical protein
MSTNMQNGLHPHYLSQMTRSVEQVGEMDRFHRKTLAARATVVGTRYAEPNFGRVQAAANVLKS